MLRVESSDFEEDEFLEAISVRSCHLMVVAFFTFATKSRDLIYLSSRSFVEDAAVVQEGC